MLWSRGQLTKEDEVIGGETEHGFPAIANHFSPCWAAFAMKSVGTSVKSFPEMRRSSSRFNEDMESGSLLSWLWLSMTLRRFGKASATLSEIASRRFPVPPSSEAEIAKREHQQVGWPACENKPLDCFGQL